MRTKQSKIATIQYLIIGLGIIVCVWLLPALYRLVAPNTSRTPFVVYSCLDSSFIQFETINKQVQYADFKGNTFAKHEADSLLPLFAFRQLVAEGRLPDSLFGVALTPKLIQQNAFHFKTSPKQLNKPAVGLYTLLESASGRVDLQLPPDVFRLTDKGIEFIDCETNTVNKAKSLSFSRELEKHGFVFPVQLIWGNGSTRKDYDNGFLLTDSQNRLFQLKMVKGTPWVRAIKTDGCTITGYKQLFTIEPANRLLVGLVVSDDNQLYAVRADGSMTHIGIDFYDPQTMQITIIGDMFHWTISEYTATDSRYYAVDARTFEQVERAIIPDPAPSIKERIMRYVLPVRLRFTSWDTQLIAPNFE